MFAPYRVAQKLSRLIINESFAIWCISFSSYFFKEVLRSWYKEYQGYVISFLGSWCLGYKQICFILYSLTLFLFYKSGQSHQNLVASRLPPTLRSMHSGWKGVKQFPETHPTATLPSFVQLPKTFLTTWYSISQGCPSLSKSWLL